MFLAIAVFMVQGVLVWNSQIAAATGSMPEPAITISGSLHYHDMLAGNVHQHASDAGEGHVHPLPPVDGDDDRATVNGCVSICSLFAASLSFPVVGGIAVPGEVASDFAATSSDWRPGVDPAALKRPPSISSIA